MDWKFHLMIHPVVSLFLSSAYFVRNLVKKGMNMKNENKKESQMWNASNRPREMTIFKSNNRATWIEVCRIQAIDSWSKECFLPQMTPLFNQWMLPMLVWMCLLISIGCCAHQMDVVVQKAIPFLCNKNFVSSIMGITGHLHCQVNLISEKQYKCPWFVNTCWLSIEQFLSWLILNRPHLTQHFDEKRPSCFSYKVLLSFGLCIERFCPDWIQH